MKATRDAILTTAAMGRADRYAIEQGRAGYELMQAAGRGIITAIVSRYAQRPTAVLCGPGNNGGDGWQVADGLKALGWPVRVFSLVPRDKLKGDAALAAQKWEGDIEPLTSCDGTRFGLIVDALFGAGLTRPLEGEAARLAEASANSPVTVCVDVPSGVHGDKACADGPSFKADLTVTFHQFKPAHLLGPARAACGETVLVDIGIPDGWEAASSPCATVNHPALWPSCAAGPAQAAHKHSRGRVCVLSGPAGATGAARLAARAALVGGAGFVSLLTTPGLAHDIALAEPSIVTQRYDPADQLADTLQNSRADAAVLGPGGGLTKRLKAQVLSALSADASLVLDADALSVFADTPGELFNACHAKVVLTPHGGEFARLFPDLASDLALNKIEQTRAAAARAGCTVLFKGADTVIATEAGEVRVNVHASPMLATAGTGDVLAGLIAASIAQGSSPLDAASAGAWIHGEAGRRCGPGSTVLTVLDKLPGALFKVQQIHKMAAARRRINAKGD